MDQTMRSAQLLSKASNTDCAEIVLEGGGLDPARAFLGGYWPVGRHDDAGLGQNAQDTGFPPIGERIEQQLIERKPQPYPDQDPAELVSKHFGDAAR